MIIAVASGKGGTGKTTVATSLALSIAEDGATGPEKPLFLDCDVEEPNAALFLRPTLTSLEEVGILIPQVDLDRCTYCGRCAEVCLACHCCGRREGADLPRAVPRLRQLHAELSGGCHL